MYVYGFRTSKQRDLMMTFSVIPVKVSSHYHLWEKHVIVINVHHDKQGASKSRNEIKRKTERKLRPQ